MQLFINIPHKFETAVIDANGDFDTGLTVTYEIRKCLDDSLIASGTMAGVGSVYSATYTFTEIGEYRVKYITPDTYENGFESVIVDDYVKYKADVSGLALETSLVPLAKEATLAADALKVQELHELSGLDAAKPLVVTRKLRKVGTISQTLLGTANEVVVQRL